VSSEWSLPSSFLTKILYAFQHVLFQGLEDESSVCCRQTLTAIALCLPELLESMESHSALAILKALPLVVNNSYWLVKVSCNKQKLHWYVDFSRLKHILPVV